MNLFLVGGCTVLFECVMDFWLPDDPYGGNREKGRRVFHDSGV
jgi:hypothetical protein